MLRKHYDPPAWWSVLVLLALVPMVGWLLWVNVWAFLAVFAAGCLVTRALSTREAHKHWREETRDWRERYGPVGSKRWRATRGSAAGHPAPPPGASAGASEP